MASMAYGQYIPPDRYGGEHRGSDLLRANKGQVLGTDLNPRNDVKAYMEGSPVGIYVRDSSRISFTYATLHHDSIIPDTAYRVDMAIGATKMMGPELLVDAPGVANYYRGRMGWNRYAPSAAPPIAM